MEENKQCLFMDKYSANSIFEESEELVESEVNLNVKGQN